jgi:sugar lactone lactonase YvrE
VGVFLVTFCGVGASSASASVQQEIATMYVSDSLVRTENPLSNEGQWASLGWGSKKTGQATTEGWSPTSTFPTVDGAYWKYRQLSDAAGGGEAVSVTKEGSTGSSEQMGAIWLDMPTPASAQTGYRLAWFQNAEGTYTLKLGKFEAGVEKSLGEKKGLSIPKGQTLALSDLGGSVAAWMGSGTALELLLSANDTAFSTGYAGIEGNGSSTRLTNFKASTFGPSPILENLPILDALSAYNYPFNGGSKWAKPSWLANMGGIDTSEEWRTRNPSKVPGGGNSGIYWSQSTFSSSTNGNGVAVELGEKPNTSEVRHQVVWLNMPNPGQTKSGYELSWTHVESPNNIEYEFVLSRWDAGKQTVLASRKDVKYPFYNVYLLDNNGSLTAWVDHASSYDLQLAVKDTTYLSGYAGIQADDGQSTAVDGWGALKNFGAANIPIPPTATTEAATKITEWEATLNAKVNPKGNSTTYQFEYGTTTAYGSFPSYPGSAGSGSSDVAVSSTFGTVDHLKPETTYHYRVVARNAGGTTYGEDKTFTTADAIAATYTSSFGSYGTGNGQYNHAGGIGETTGGNFWIADVYNHRLQKVNPKGEYLGQQITKAADGLTLGLTGLAVDSKNNIWITDWAHDRVEEFNEKGEFVRRFGSEGTGNGQFYIPEGVAIDSRGNVWVADWGNKRVQEFNEKGEFIRVVGSAQLKGPSAIAVGPGDNVWVADWSGHQVVEFNEKGEYVRSIGSGSYSTANGQFSYPVAIATDPSGNVWVSDQENGRVERFTEKGEYLGKLGTPGSGEGQFSFGYPNGIVADHSGNLWVTDGNNSRVQKWKIKPETWGGNYTTAANFWSSFGSAGSGNGQFSHTGGVGRTTGGLYWVADVNNHRIQRFTHEGNYYGLQITKAGDGLTLYPSGLAVDSKNNIWITDWAHDRVEEFNEKGEFVRRFGSEGSGNGQFNTPEGVAIDSKGNVWVADSANGRVQEFNEKGEFIRVVGSKGSELGQLQGPSALAIGPGDNVWVADWSGHRVDEFNEKGEFVRRFGSEGTGYGQFKHPVAIAVDTKGYVWVADQENARIQRFNEVGAYAGQAGTAGSANGQFNFGYPNGMIYDPIYNDVVITNGNNNRVDVWNPNY